MKPILTTLFTVLFLSSFLFSQNVAINTTGVAANASSMLDVNATDKGVLVPRIALTATNVAAPVVAPLTSLLVFNTATAGAGATAVAPGYYWWDGAQWVRLFNTGNAWQTSGNYGTNPAVNFAGTVDAQDFVIRTNNTEKMRITSGGNAGIGIAIPLERLHVSGGNVRISNLAGVGNRMVYADVNGTLAIVAAGANGQVLTQTAGGPAWQTNPGWLITGNAGTNGGTTVAAGVNFIGTTDNQNLDFRTNNIYRGRVSNLGEFFIGSLNTVITGDLMNAVSNVTFPWAANGYSAFDGSGVYGQVTAGTTIFAGVQGEYNGTNASGAGVRGLSVNGTAGTGFNAAHSGVSGNATTNGAYKFGVFGSGGTTTRSGGVFGYDYGIAMGALGYYAFSGLDYGVYGFGQAYFTGLGTGMLPSEFYKLYPDMDPLSKPNNNIGLGIYGGVMGGWVKGMVYGTAFSGDRFATYTDGKSVTNDLIISLIDNNTESRTIAYAPVSLTADIQQKGKTKLENGTAIIRLSADLTNVIDLNSIVINITPMGQSNGLYVEKITKEGIVVKENNGGNATIDFCWSLSATRTDIKSEVSPEIANDNFDQKLEGVMFNENNNIDQPTALWWDGEKIRFDPIPEEMLMLIRGNNISEYNKIVKQYTRNKEVIKK